MNRQEISERPDLNVHIYRLVSYGLVASMMACAAATITYLLSRIDPDWQLHYLPFVCFIVALDRLYTYRLFRDWVFLSREWLIRLAAQIIAIAVFTKLIVGLSHGWPAFLAEIPLWQQDFSAHFFNGEMRFVLTMIVIVWLICGNFADLLEEIGPDQIVSARLDLARFGLEQAIPARKRLISLFYSLGAALVVVTALSRLDLRAMLYENTYSFFVEIPALAAGGAATLLYFVLGLALLSQTQFISLHIRWTIQQIPINGKLAKQWLGYSLLFLVLMLLLVSFLPTSYSIQPLLILSYLLNLALFAYLAIGQTILAFALYILAMMFGKEPPAPNEPLESPMLPEIPPEISGTAGTGLDWWEITKTVVFWAIFLGVVFFAVRQYLRQHQEVFEKLRKLPAWRFLVQAWQWLQRLLAQAKSVLTDVVEAGRERARELAVWQGFGAGWMNLRQLDPRQRIYFFYLALVRRAGEKGLPRGLSQTPDEYGAALQAALPAAGEDIHALTQAFIEARYSRQPVESEKASRVESAWERIRKTLRGKLPGRR